MKAATTSIARRFALIAVLASVAMLGACSETATTAPTRPKANARTLHDGEPPNSACSSGWVVIDGVWTCAG